MPRLRRWWATVVDRAGSRRRRARYRKMLAQLQQSDPENAERLWAEAWDVTIQWPGLPAVTMRPLPDGSWAERVEGPPEP